MPSSGDTKVSLDECPPVPTALVEYLETVFDLGPPQFDETVDRLRFRAGTAAIINFLRAHHDAQQSDGTMGKVL